MIQEAFNERIWKARQAVAPFNASISDFLAAGWLWPFHARDGSSLSRLTESLSSCFRLGREESDSISTGT
jgi:hypothetical protein